MSFIILLIGISYAQEAFTQDQGRVADEDIARRLPSFHLDIRPDYKRCFF